MKKLLPLVLMLAVPLGLAADVILAPTFVTAQDTNPAPAGTTFAPGPGGLVGGLDSGLFSIDVGPQAGTLSVTIADCCFQGNVFEVVVDGVSIGVGDPSVATGSSPPAPPSTLTAFVSAGAHTVGIWDITLSYIGFDSPFGGFVGAIYSPAGLTVSIDFVPIPEPATLLLLGTGLLAVGGAARRKLKMKRKAT